MSAAAAEAPPLVADLATVRAYLGELYDTANDGCLPIFRVPTERTDWVPIRDLDAAAATIGRRCDQGFSVFHGMGLHPIPLGEGSRGAAAGVYALPGPFMDLDVKHVAHAQTALPETVGDALELLKEFPLPASVLVDSGHGIYAHWLFREVLAIADEHERERVASLLKRLQAEIRRLGREHGWIFEPTDDLARVLRPPGVVNRKPNVEPVPTRFLHQGGERYTLEEIEDVLPVEADDVRSSNSHRSEQVPPKGKAARAGLDPILTDCAFMAHCRDDAATLTEPEWHSMMSIVSLCKDGERQAHALSRSYPRYTHRETQKKYERARTADKPIRCEMIEDRHGSEWCAGCVHRGTITSPIELGYARIIRPGRNGASAHADAAGEARWPVLDPAALHGLAGDVVRTIEPHTEGDPTALLVNFLVMFGSAVGPTPHARVGQTKHRVNEFAVHVGETARARKGTANNEIVGIIERADSYWRPRVQGGLSSGEGLLYAVRDPIEKPNKDGEMKLTDPGVDDKRLLAIEPEFSRVLRSAGRDGNTLSELLRCAWDGGDLRSMTRTAPLTATDPHISALGHITRLELLRELNETYQANGFANRFLFFCVRRSKELPHGGALPDADVSTLAEHVRKTLDAARKITTVRRDAETDKVWEGVYSALTAERPGMFGAITARAEAHVLRVSALYALLDCSPEIRRAHLHAALALWQYAEDSARFIFGDATGDPVADHILIALRRNGKMTQTQISDLFARNQKAGRIEQALVLLLTAGLVRTWQGESERGGRAPTYWEAVA